jgi:hypothetical protein
MRLRPFCLFTAGTAWTALAAAGADAPASSTLLGNASVKDWGTTIFSPEGYRKMTLKGTEARPVTADQIDFVDMRCRRAA